MKRNIISVIATALLCFCFIGTTYAWLVAKSNTVQNVFTAGNINISLVESTSEKRIMIPGATLSEDPKVIVKANSEDCWLFVELTKSELFDTFLEYVIADGWTLLDGTSFVYYRKVTLANADQPFDILKDNQVVVKSEPTKAQYDTINSDNYPTLTFTAYAVQQLGFDTVKAAWTEAEKLKPITEIPENP